MKRRIPYLFGLSILVWEIMQYWPTTVCVSGAASEMSVSIRMPMKDKKKLDYFFRNSCFLNGWAYTLLGSKPVSTHQYIMPLAQFQKMFAYAITHLNELPLNFREICYLLNPEQMRIKSGWFTLKRYLDVFPESAFAIFTNDKNQNVICLTLVNKPLLVEIVKNYYEDFQEILQELGIKPEDLYNEKILQAFLNQLQEDRLIGIVLGFGKNNAALYQKYREMNGREWPLISMWSEIDDQHLEKIWKKNLSFQSWDLSDLFYPYCACDPESDETKFLKQTYQEEREKIIRYYEGKEVVEATLSLFNQKVF